MSTPQSKTKAERVARYSNDRLQLILLMFTLTSVSPQVMVRSLSLAIYSGGPFRVIDLVNAAGLALLAILIASVLFLIWRSRPRLIAEVTPLGVACCKGMDRITLRATPARITFADVESIEQARFDKIVFRMRDGELFIFDLGQLWIWQRHRACQMIERATGHEGLCASVQPPKFPEFRITTRSIMVFTFVIAFFCAAYRMTILRHDMSSLVAAFLCGCFCLAIGFFVLVIGAVLVAIRPQERSHVLVTAGAVMMIGFLPVWLTLTFLFGAIELAEFAFR